MFSSNVDPYEIDKCRTTDARVSWNQSWAREQEASTNKRRCCDLALDPFTPSPDHTMAEAQAGKHKVYPASKLGEYHILRDIAEGTFGKVRSVSARPM
jgi:hypothetical protein